MMVLGRLWFGFFGQGANLRRSLMLGSLCAALCYVVAGISPSPALSLAACAASGLAVSMLWPGIVSLTAGAFPRAGVSLFALMAAFGDAGAGAGPWALGALAEHVAVEMPRWGEALGGLYGHGAETLGLRAALTLAALAPLVLAILIRGLPEHAETAAERV